MNGIYRTRVGYTGGTTASPTYRRMGDHTESLQIDFDPEQISFETILWEFWRGHRPVRPSWSKQYRSAIFYHDETQREVAIATRNQYASELDRTIHTAIEPAGTFYLAEDYHQKYSLQSQPKLMGALNAMYPEFGKVIDSTAAARMNGYMCGYGDMARLKREVADYGLPAEAQKKLIRYFMRY